MLLIQNDAVICKDMLSRLLHSAGDCQAPSESFLTPRLPQWSQQGSRKRKCIFTLYLIKLVPCVLPLVFFLGNKLICWGIFDQMEPASRSCPIIHPHEIERLSFNCLTDGLHFNSCIKYIKQILCKVVV